MIRVAVIGCGRIALEGHLPAYATARDAELVGVCDLDLARARIVGAGHRVPAFVSAAELLAETRPDVVSITTHPSSHRDLTLAALAAGCHVLCEKPIAMDLGQAREMAAAAERANRILSICFEYRYWDEAVYVRQRLAAGDVGQVKHVRTWGGATRGFPRSPAYHRRETAGGGVLTHWTIHNLDLALWLLGSPEPVSASAVGHQRTAGLPDPTIEDFAFGLVRLANGASISVEASWLHPRTDRPEGWELTADRGAASISPLRVWLDRDGRWIDDTPAPGTLAPCDYKMERLIHGFLARVREGGPAPVRPDELLRIQAVMDALYGSIEAGHEVAVQAV